MIKFIVTLRDKDDREVCFKRAVSEAADFCKAQEGTRWTDVVTATVRKVAEMKKQVKP